ncbi:MarR family winged helix-turn-helix transcriptional regulator [Actinomadura sp. NEAU-AAG7]|uniref:MarR family winged helix-turn-helix transcriptional regulator n=1 Tax=Actinomadura sp. NEAU-AAG7 TaxID=2839640 RepID=UPI001BE49B4B|nr:MarR family winged helix-turn-helix transcriptional regulator [Actinomadura sp. NEAU-AAG7]MBT2207113.1 MarR family winged helix-turn-helix transcriptional regulator [Actinomadura sp. NEAU-AAG7]
MDDAPGREDRPGQREAADRVAAALATVGNWMFAPATRRRIMASFGLEMSLGDYTLLAQVSLHGPVRLSVLAGLMEVDKSTLSPPAKRLESRGFIERHPDPADARAQLVSVTREGRLAIRELWKARADAVAALLSGWESSDVEHLAEGLGAFAEAIKKNS